jgi:hypothetical protein
MAAGKGRGKVKGMMVRGIILKRLLSIPLTNIPLTLGFSHKMTDRQSSRICVILTERGTVRVRGVKPWSSQSAGVGPVDFCDPGWTNFGRRFYRARLP